MLVKHALKTAIAAALVGALFQQSDFIAELTYPAMGLITTMQSSLGGTVKAAWGRLGGSAIGGAIGAWLVSTQGASPAIGGLAFILSTLICEAFQLQAPYNQAGVVSALIAVTLMGHGSNPWVYASNRVLDNWIGVVIGIGITLLFWPDNPKKTLSDSIIKFLRNSNQLFQEIVAYYQAGEGQKSVNSSLITEMTSNIQQSESILKKEMYGFVGNKLAQENWSNLLAIERRLCRHLSVMFKTLQQSNSSQLRHQFTGPLMLIAHQVSATCDALTQIVQSTDSASSTFKLGSTTAVNINPALAIAEIPVLESHLRSMVNQVNLMKKTGTIKDYPIQEIRQFYVFLYSLKKIIQELAQLALALLNREKITTKSEVRSVLQFHPVQPERVRHIFKTGIAIWLCLLVLNDWFHLPFNYYAIVAVVIAMQPTFGRGMAAGSQRVLVTGIGAVFAFCLIHTLGSNPFTLALGITLTIMTCSYLGFSQGYTTGCILVTLSILSHEDSPNSYILGRFVETLVGTLIALILSQLFWPSTSSQQLIQEISSTLIKLKSIYKTLVNSYLQGIDSEAVITQLSREIKKSLQTQALLQKETQQEPVHYLTAPRTQQIWNLMLSHEKELFQNMESLQDTVWQSTSVMNFPTDLQNAMQALAQATIFSFTSLAAATHQHSSQWKLSSLITFEAAEQALLRLRTSGTDLEYSLDEIISSLAVLSAMEEVTENLNQMANDLGIASQ